MSYDGNKWDNPPTEQQPRPLTPAEQALLARENAADRYGYPYHNPPVTRRAFTDGWDAALAWVEEQRKASEVEG